MKPVAIPVTRVQDAAMVRSAALRLARGAGLSARRAVEAAIVVSELTTNTVKHGGGGTIRLWVHAGALHVEAEDCGGGRTVVEARLRRTPPLTADLHADPAPLWGGLNAGLDAVTRFSDEVSVADAPQGLIVRAVCRER